MVEGDITTTAVAALVAAATIKVAAEEVYCLVFINSENFISRFLVFFDAYFDALHEQTSFVLH